MFVISLAIVVSISVILVAVPKSSDAEIRQKIADEETRTYNRPGVGRIVIFVLIGVTCFFAPVIATVQQATMCVYPRPLDEYSRDKAGILK